MDWSPPVARSQPNELERNLKKLVITIIYIHNQTISTLKILSLQWFIRINCFSKANQWLFWYAQSADIPRWYTRNDWNFWWIWDQHESKDAHFKRASGFVFGIPKLCVFFGRTRRKPSQNFQSFLDKSSSANKGHVGRYDVSFAWSLE